MPQLFEYEKLEDNFKLAKKLDLDFIEFNLNFKTCRQGLFTDEIKETRTYDMPKTPFVFVVVGILALALARAGGAC